MPWVRLTDDWYDDPDIIDAGPLAMLLWPVLISWSARNLQDGKIPAGQIRRLVDWSALGAEPEQAVASLVAAGRLQETAGGYLIVNFLKYQPSRAKVLSDRDASKDRAAKSRASKTERAEPVREPCADAADAPVPGPVPDVSSSSSSSSATRKLPAGLWTKVAEKQLTRTTAQVASPGAWKRKAASNAEADMGERAEWLWENYTLTESQLVDLLLSGGSPAWLNGLRKAAS